jgi:hypothetical protein
MADFGQKKTPAKAGVFSVSNRCWEFSSRLPTPDTPGRDTTAAPATTVTDVGQIQSHEIHLHRFHLRSDMPTLGPICQDQNYQGRPGSAP